MRSSKIKWYDWDGDGDIPSGVKEVCFADGGTMDNTGFLDNPSFWKVNDDSSDIIAYTLGEKIEGGE